MNGKDLKKIIKKYVRESLNEILAEKYLTEMRAAPKKKPLQDIFMPQVSDDDIAKARQKQKIKKPQPKDKPQLRENLIRKLGINNGTMANVFRDTYSNLDERVSSEKADPAGTVPEQAMKDIGIMDYNWEAFIK